MGSPEKGAQSSGGPEALLEFKVPEIKDIKAYFVKLDNGKIVARTEEELEEIKKEQGKGKK